MAVTPRGGATITGTATTSETSIAATATATTQEGDYIHLQVGLNSGSVTPTISGFTLVGQIFRGNNYGQHAFRKQATASEPSTYTVP